MSSENQYNQWMADIDQEVKAWNEMAEKIEAENLAWKAKWPNYCRACGGWGMIGAPASTPEDPGPDPCEAEPYCGDHCHRCGGEMTQAWVEDGDPENGPHISLDKCLCIECGWSWDDGLKQL